MACAAVRQAVADANKCGCKPPDDPRLQCKGLTAVPASCAVWGLAQRRDNLFQVQYSPEGASPFASSVNRVAHERAVADLQADVAKLEGQVRAAFPALTDADLADIEYWKMQRCLADGAERAKYFDRPRLQAAGYAATPLVNVKVPDSLALPTNFKNLVPVMADRLAPPEIVLLFILLVLVAAALGLYALSRQQRKTAYARAVRQREAGVAAAQAADPWARMFGAPTVREDPDDKLRALVPQYEAQGYCMSAYRQKLGMPPGPKC